MNVVRVQRGHELIREVAETIAREAISPFAARHDHEISVPVEMLRSLHEHHLLGLCVPEELGGGGSNIIFGKDPLAYLLVLEELARADMASAHCYQVHVHAVQMLAAAATREQQRRYFEPIIHAGEVISWTATEPGGSARGHYSMLTEARPTADGLSLTGIKTYATLGSVGSWNLIHGALPDLPVPQNMIMVMIPRNAPGLVVDEGWWRPLGMRAAVSPRLELKEVKVPHHDIINDGGFYARGSYGSRWHLAFGMAHLGAARGIFDFVCEYLPRRGTTANPHTQRAVGEMMMQIEAARCLLYQAASHWEGNDTRKAEQSSLMAKLFAMSIAEWITAEAIRVVGSTALLDEHPLSRQIRNIHMQSTHANLHNTAQSIGCAHLGLDYDSANQQ